MPDCLTRISTLSFSVDPGKSLTLLGIHLVVVIVMLYPELLLYSNKLLYRKAQRNARCSQGKWSPLMGLRSSLVLNH